MLTSTFSFRCVTLCLLQSACVQQTLLVFLLSIIRVPQCTCTACYVHWPAAPHPGCIARHTSSRVDLYLLLQESRHLLDAVLSVQPRMVGSTGGRSSDDLVAGLAADIQQALPALMSVEEACIPRDPFAPLPKCGCPCAGMRACVKGRRICSCLAASPGLPAPRWKHAAYHSRLQGWPILPLEHWKVVLHPCTQSTPLPLPSVTHFHYSRFCIWSMGRLACPAKLGAHQVACPALLATQTCHMPQLCCRASQLSGRGSAPGAGSL